MSKLPDPFKKSNERIRCPRPHGHMASNSAVTEKNRVVDVGATTTDVIAENTTSGSKDISKTATVISKKISNTMRMAAKVGVDAAEKVAQSNRIKAVSESVQSEQGKDLAKEVGRYAIVEDIPGCRLDERLPAQRQVV